jgi:peptide/nickel transport system substrate-binding protein
MERCRKYVVIGVLLITGGCLAGCGGSSGASAGGGGELRLGAAYGVDSLNPFVGINSLDSMSYRVLYPFLLQYNDSNQIVTDWAKSYSVSDGGRIWRFVVPTDDKWSDGWPLTAADAAWTINTMVKYQNTGAAVYAAYLSNLTGATAPSPSTVVVRFSKQTSTAAYGIANIPILPEHVWSRYAIGNGSGLVHFANTSPVSSGPFQLSKYTYQQSVLFTRNPHYWGPEPKLSGFGMVAYTSTDAATSALTTDQIDVLLEAPPTVLKTLQRNPSIKLENAANYDVSQFWINSSKHAPHPELRNPRVREAIMLAINRPQMDDVINLGYGATGSAILSPNNPFADKSLPPVAYDPAKADQLLNALGFKMGSGGIRIANGHPMSYIFRTPNVTNGYPQNAALLVSDLRHVGIQLNEVTSDYKSYLAAIHSANDSTFDFGLDDNNPTFDPSQFMSQLICSQVNVENDGAYCNPQYDTLYNEQLSQVGPARQATLNRMQELAYEDKPYIPLFWGANVFALRSDVHGFPPTPLPTIDYESTLWLDQVTL